MKLASWRSSNRLFKNLNNIGQGSLNSSQKTTVRCEADHSSFSYQLFEDLRDYEDHLFSDENDKWDSFEDSVQGALEAMEGEIICNKNTYKTPVS